MATYLSIVNRVLHRLNEVELSQSTFAGAREFQLFIKEAVNDAVSDIVQEQLEWPFLIADKTQALTSGVHQYSLPADCATVDWESFCIQYDGTATPVITAQELRYLDLDDWQETRQADDLNAIATSNGFDKPRYVYRTEDAAGFGVTPVPDKAYNLKFKYFKRLTDMANYDDVCVIPDRFINTLVDGTLVYAHAFRENTTLQQIAQKRFEEGVTRMRVELINYQKTMRSGMLHGNR